MGARGQEGEPGGCRLAPVGALLPRSLPGAGAGVCENAHGCALTGEDPRPRRCQGDPPFVASAEDHRPRPVFLRAPVRLTDALH